MIRVWERISRKGVEIGAIVEEEEIGQDADGNTFRIGDHRIVEMALMSQAVEDVISEMEGESESNRKTAVRLRKMFVDADLNVHSYKAKRKNLIT